MHLDGIHIVKGRTVKIPHRQRQSSQSHPAAHPATLLRCFLCITLTLDLSSGGCASTSWVHALQFSHWSSPMFLFPIKKFYNPTLTIGFWTEL